MKYLVVGLGNIGAEYADTRHNIGFRVLDALAEASNVSFMAGRYGSTATVRHKGRQILLLKPSTYMNLSGKAVRYWMEQEKIPIEKVLIISDDIALPFGQLRMRKKGSAGVIYIQMGTLAVNILSCKCSAVMRDGTFAHHCANRSLHLSTSNLYNNMVISLNYL